MCAAAKRLVKLPHTSYRKEATNRGLAFDVRNVACLEIGLFLCRVFSEAR